MDAGVRKGHTYDNVTVIMIAMKNATPRPVKLMRVYATKALMDYMYRQRSPQARSRRVAWSIIGRLSMKKRNGKPLQQSHLMGAGMGGMVGVGLERPQQKRKPAVGKKKTA